MPTVDRGLCEVDFCSIDIDGLDLDVFEAIKKNLPKVVCIEGGQMLDPMAGRVSPQKASHNVQQSLCVLYSSFSARGYELVCSHQDSFFIKRVRAAFHRKKLRRLFFSCHLSLKRLAYL